MEAGILERGSVAQLTRLVDQFIAGRAALFAEAHGRGTHHRRTWRSARRRHLLRARRTGATWTAWSSTTNFATSTASTTRRSSPWIWNFSVAPISATPSSTNTVAAPTIPHRRSLTHFYIAYRAVVRAKVDCIRVSQGHQDARAHARRHIDIALKRLRTATVRLILVGGGPGTGKTTLSRGLSEQVDAQVISTDDARRQLQQAGCLSGAAGELDQGLYSRENVAKVYDEVLRQAGLLLRQRYVGDSGRDLA